MSETLLNLQNYRRVRKTNMYFLLYSSFHTIGTNYMNECILYESDLSL